MRWYTEYLDLNRQPSSGYETATAIRTAGTLPSYVNGDPDDYIDVNDTPCPFWKRDRLSTAAVIQTEAGYYRVPLFCNVSQIVCHWPLPKFYTPGNHPKA